MGCMPLVRTEMPAASREAARRLLDRYRDGGRDPRLEGDVADELSARGLTPRGRPRLAGSTSGNPPLLLWDTDVESDVGG